MMHALSPPSLYFLEHLARAFFSDYVLSQHILFKRPVAEFINADPSALSLFTTELGSESGERPGEKNCIQSESDFLLACDDLNTEREVGHEIMVCEAKELLLQGLVQNMLNLNLQILREWRDRS